jgi:hypothetical protein
MILLIKSFKFILFKHSFSVTFFYFPLTNFSSLIHFPLLRYPIPTLHLVCVRLSPPPSLTFTLSLHRHPYLHILSPTPLDLPLSDVIKNNMVHPVTWMIFIISDPSSTPFLLPSSYHRRQLAFPVCVIIIGEDSFVITSRQFGIDCCLQCFFQGLVPSFFLESIMLFSR